MYPRIILGYEDTEQSRDALALAPARIRRHPFDSPVACHSTADALRLADSRVREARQGARTLSARSCHGRAGRAQRGGPLDRDWLTNRAVEGHAALRTAATLASDLGARLRAITVHESFVQARHSVKHASDEEGLVEDELDRALADVQASDAECIALSGGAATCLAEACVDTDLLVVGSRSYGPVRHTLLGSVSAKLMRSCPAPLLVVPRSADTSGQDAGPGAERLSRAPT